MVSLLCTILCFGPSHLMPVEGSTRPRGAYQTPAANTPVIPTPINTAATPQSIARACTRSVGCSKPGGHVGFCDSLLVNSTAPTPATAPTPSGFNITPAEEAQPPASAPTPVDKNKLVIDGNPKTLSGSNNTYKIQYREDGKKVVIPCAICGTKEGSRNWHAVLQASPPGTYFQNPDDCNLDCCIGLSFQVLGTQVTCPLTWSSLGNATCPTPSLEKLICHHKCYVRLDKAVQSAPLVTGLESPTKTQLQARVVELEQAQGELQHAAAKGQKIEARLREHFPGFMEHEEVGIVTHTCSTFYIIMVSHLYYITTLPIQYIMRYNTIYYPLHYNTDTTYYPYNIT